MDIDDTIDYTLAQDEGKTNKVNEKGESSAQQQSTDRQDEGTDMPKVSTARTKLSTDKFEEGIAEPELRESTSSVAQTTPTPSLTTFGDDKTIAQVLLNMIQAKSVSKEKEKGVEIRNAKNVERPRTTSTKSVLTLKPLPKIDPNDKGIKRIKEDVEFDTESKEITEAKKKIDQIAHDEEIALSNEYDFIQARIKADRLLAKRVQKAEREQFTIEERAKFIYDTIATQRRILAQQRSKAIRNKPPTKNQFRNQMMTYLKHVGNKKHADLKTKNERKIKEMNEGASDPDKKKKFVKEDVSTNVPAKQDVAEQGTKKRKGGHMNMIARKRKRPQPDVDGDDEHRKCLKIVTFEGTIDSEIIGRKSFISKLDKVSSPKGDYLVVYRVNENFRAFNYLIEVLHIFDRQDLFHLYDLVMKQYSESTPKDWEIVTWILYEAYGVCILDFKDGIVIHMLVERKYPLSKELLQRMLDFGLEVKVESIVALDLIRKLHLSLRLHIRSGEESSTATVQTVNGYVCRDTSLVAKRMVSVYRVKHKGEIFIGLMQKVLDLQKAKDAQAKEIAVLKKRIQRLERRNMSRPTGLKRLNKIGMIRRVKSSEDQESLGSPEDASKYGRSIEDIDADVDVSLVDKAQKKQIDDLMFDSGLLEDDVMHVEAKVDGKDEHSKKSDDSTAGEAVTTASINDSAVPTTNEEITLA
ncbi:hypothetical protein Tco_0001418 [Tanacetum coccineum]